MSKNTQAILNVDLYTHSSNQLKAGFVFPFLIGTQHAETKRFSVSS